MADNAATTMTTRCRRGALALALLVTLAFPVVETTVVPRPAPEEETPAAAVAEKESELLRPRRHDGLIIDPCHHRGDYYGERTAGGRMVELPRNSLSEEEGEADDGGGGDEEGVAAAAGSSSASSVRLVELPRRGGGGELAAGEEDADEGSDVLVASSRIIAPPSSSRGALSSSSSRTPRHLLLDGTTPPQHGKQRQSTRHTKLATNYRGDVPSSSVEFSLMNHRPDGKHAVISSMGLNVRVAPAAVAADDAAAAPDPDAAAAPDAVVEQEPAECRVRIYTKRHADDLEGIVVTQVSGEDGAAYRLALDAKVLCAGEGKETLLSTHLFVENYRARQQQQQQEEEEEESGGERRRLFEDAEAPNGMVGEAVRQPSSASLSQKATGRRRRTIGEDDRSAAVHRAGAGGERRGDRRLDVENMEEGTVTGSSYTADAANPGYVPRGDGLMAGEVGWPLLVPPNATVSVYVVVSPIDDDATEDGGPSFWLLSSKSSNQGTGGLYITDPNINLYEGRSITGGNIADDLVGEATVREPTAFNGAVYYDSFDGSEVSLTEYYDELEYSLLPGDSLHGLPGCDGALDTGYIDTVGSYGFMFDVTSSVSTSDPHVGLSKEDSFLSSFKDVEIYGMDLYIRSFVNASFTVYVRDDGGGEYVSYARAAGQTLIGRNWQLIAGGIVEGKGPDVPSPIPERLWRRNVVIQPGQTVGFYVTVHDAPDLRYRNTSLPEGEVHASNDVLQIGVGRSWGEHPLRGDGTDVFFSPREFAGGLRYHLQDGLCGSEAPSSAPTFPSITSAPSASSQPTQEGVNRYDETAEEEGLCPGEGGLETTFQDGTGSFGALFDVLPKTRVTITGIDLNMDWTTGDEAEVLIYARQGSWFGHQNDADSWPHLLVNTTLRRPPDFHNRTADGAYIPISVKKDSAKIPKSAFTPLAMEPGETYSIYVCTSLADFRYTLGTSIGKTFADNPEIRVMEGAGAADWPPFKGGAQYGGAEYTFYAPRLFNGNLRYDYVSECDSEPPSAFDATPVPTPLPTLTTDITYMFYVEHAADKLAGMITYDMSFGVRAVLDDAMGGNEDILHALATRHDLEIQDVDARLVSALDVGYLCVPTPPETCTAVAVDVTATHRTTATEDEVMYALLRLAPNLPNLMDVDGYTIENVGERAVETSSEITLGGVPDREMQGFELEYFAQVARDFLDRQAPLHDDINDSLRILSVVVNGQEITSSYEPVDGTLDGDSTSSSSSSFMPGRNNSGRRLKKKNNKIKVNVKGKYKPPPELDLGEVVEESINRDRELLKKELSRDPPPALMQGNSTEFGLGYFEEVEVIGARNMQEESDRPALGTPILVLSQDEKDKEALKSMLNFTAMGVGGLIMLLSAVFLLRPRRRRAMFGGSGVDDRAHRGTQNIDAENHSILKKSRAMIRGGLHDSGSSSDKQAYNLRGSADSERMLAYSDFSQVPQPGGSFSSGPNGFDPHGSGSGSFNPHGSGSGGFNPQGSGTSGFNPQGSGTSGFNPRGSGTSGFNPRGSGTSGFNPRGSGTSGFNPLGSGTSGFNPRGSGTSGFNPRGSGTSGFNPRGSGTSGFNPRGSGTSGFNPRGSGNSGRGPPLDPHSSGLVPEQPHPFARGTPHHQPVSTRAPPRRGPPGENFVHNSMPPEHRGMPPVASRGPNQSMPPQRAGGPRGGQDIRSSMRPSGYH